MSLPKRMSFQKARVQMRAIVGSSEKVAWRIEKGRWEGGVVVGGRDMGWDVGGGRCCDVLGKVSGRYWDVHCDG